MNGYGYYPYTYEDSGQVSGQQRFFRVTKPIDDLSIVPGEYSTETPGLFSEHLISLAENEFSGVREIPSWEYFGAASRGRMPTFYHSGDLGDIIYSLPTVKALGRGKLFLGQDTGIPSKAKTRVPMNGAQFEFLHDLLKLQPYILDVEYSETVPTVNFNLNLFREFLLKYQQHHYWKKPGFKGFVNLQRVHEIMFGLEPCDVKEPWLKVDSKWIMDEFPIVIHRSLRYRNHAFPWMSLLAQYWDKMLFIGLEIEYVQFRRDFGYDVEFFGVSNGLQMARVIAGARLFIGNQSFPYALAEGLKQNSIQETDEDSNCMFKRSNAFFFKNADDPFPMAWVGRWV